MAARCSLAQYGFKYSIGATDIRRQCGGISVLSQWCLKIVEEVEVEKLSGDEADDGGRKSGE